MVYLKFYLISAYLCNYITQQNNALFQELPKVVLSQLYKHFTRNKYNNEVNLNYTSYGSRLGLCSKGNLVMLKANTKKTNHLKERP